MSHRQLSAAEIRRLEAQGCTARDWSCVRVREPFAPDRVQATHFSGEVRLGRLSGALATPGGVEVPAGVFHSRLHECTIGDGSAVWQVGALANYDVADGVLLEQVGSLRVTGETAFGNGTAVEVLNEAGGRSLLLCDRLSAQLAYLIVLYRHRPELVARLTDLVHRYASTRTGTRGAIGEGARVRRAGAITNVDVGAHARLEGCARLEEGTIRSCREAPAYVGEGVSARHFIILSGAHVDDGALLERCLVGQHVRIGRQFSAENSVFFCNSELYHGEACSVFGGPYTVSHHKSTLLIAGLFSFYNAGSGTNQSNHMYKLGPVHQGILERGCKTGSSSYLLWPSRVGAFSSIIGKHYVHFDSSDLPFSMVSEHDRRTVCIPAMNLFTVGTRRDGEKWPARDGRTDPERLDHVHFAVLSPYTIGKVLRGLERLAELAAKAREGQEYLNFGGIAVQKLLVRTTARYYEMAVRLFIGRCLARRLETLASPSAEALAAALAADAAPALDPWLDIAGLLVSEPALEALLQDVLRGEVSDLAAFQDRCAALWAAYETQEWAWCARLIETRTGRPLAQADPGTLAELLRQWQETTLKFDNMVIQDARKEFEADVMTGYGIDGDAAVRRADFAAVRGSHDLNAFVRAMRADAEQTALRAEALIARLAALAPPIPA